MKTVIFQDNFTYNKAITQGYGKTSAINEIF